MDIGVQLWSYTSDEQDISFRDRIKLASEMGFNSIEYAGGYEEIEPDELFSILKKLNLTLPSAHVAFNKLDESLPYLASVGVKHIICPSAPYNSHEEALIIAKRLNEFGEKCRPYGIKTGFHNHAGDYFVENGKAIADTLYDNTNPETVIIQLDIGHAVGGGVDPYDYLERYKGRIESIHIKENKGSLVLDKPRSYYDKGPKWNFTIDENGKKVFEKAFYEEKVKHEAMAVAMGTSIIDWAKIIKVAKEQYPEVTCIIEREVSYNRPKDRLACIKEDLDYIRGCNV